MAYELFGHDPALCARRIGRDLCLRGAELRNTLDAQRLVGRLEDGILSLTEMPYRAPLSRDPRFAIQGVRAPEDRWAFINVSRIVADNPAEDVLSSRIGKELWRTLGFLLTRDGFNDDSVMDPIQDAVALDALKYDSLMREKSIDEFRLKPSELVVKLLLAFATGMPAMKVGCASKHSVRE